MIHHPVILIPKLILLAVIIAALIVLHGTLNAAQFQLALIIAAAGFICCTVVIWIVGLRALSNPNSKWAKATTLSHEARAEDGFTASSDQFQALVGARGTAASALRHFTGKEFGKDHQEWQEWWRANGSRYRNGR